MSTPVVTDKWTGNFDCNGPCRRKRLMANEFSKKAIQNYHRRQQQNNERFILRCKQCVAAAEQAERDASAEQSRRRKQQQQQQQVEAAATAGEKEKEETRKCAGKCSKILIQSEFNRNQWAKGNGKSRCRTCVEESIRDETIQQAQAKETKLKAARDKLQSIRSSNNSNSTTPQAILAAESELAALEAEQVTGLKPIKMSRGGGRGRGGRGIRAGGRGARGKR